MGPVLYGLLLPTTVITVGLAGWYIYCGETPAALASRLLQGPRISMAMPARPGAEPPAAALMRPPEASPASEAKPITAVAEPVAEKPAEPKTEAVREAPVQPEPPAAKMADKPAESAPETSAEKPAEKPMPPPPAPPQSTYLPPPPPPALAEPATPPGGESLAPPSFAQLPSPHEAGKPLALAPLPELLRQTANGALPIKAGGKQAWKLYARPVGALQSKPGVKIAVLVTDLGLSRDATNAAIAKLPADVSLSFSPYASTLDGWIKRARESGHEALLDLPLEPPNFPQHDPGSYAVLQSHSPGEAIGHLEQVLGRAGGYVGVAASLHSPVTASDSWPLMLQELRERGLLVLADGLVGIEDKVMPAAGSIALVVDETPFRTAIDAKLSRALATAQRDGSAIISLSPRPVSFERLLAFIASLPEKNVTLVPVSALVRPEP